MLKNKSRFVSNYQLNAHFLYSITIFMSHYNPRHVSSSTMLIFRRTNCITAASGIVTLCKRLHSKWVESSALNPCTVQPFTESDDTRCCSDTICPPEDEHSTAWNMSRIIMWHIYCYKINELCIKLVIWNKSILWCTTRKTSKVGCLWKQLWFF